MLNRIISAWYCLTRKSYFLMSSNHKDAGDFFTKVGNGVIEVMKEDGCEVVNGDLRMKKITRASAHKPK